MKRIALCASIACIASTNVIAETVAPTDVKFVEGAVEMSLTGQAGDVANGRKIMNKGAGNCIACHVITELEELAFQGDVGPPLDGVADRWSQAELRGIVSNAKVMFEGTRMPSFYKTEGFTRLGNAYTGKAHEGEVKPLLSAQEVEDVVVYLMTLKEQ